MNNVRTEVEYEWSPSPEFNAWIVAHVLRPQALRQFRMVTLLVPLLALPMLYPQWRDGRLDVPRLLLALCLMAGVVALGMLLQTSLYLREVRRSGILYRITRRGLYLRAGFSRGLIPWKRIRGVRFDPLAEREGAYRANVGVRYLRNPIPLYLEERDLPHVRRGFARHGYTTPQ